MPDKSPHTSSAKKLGKSLKEKRAAKAEKAAQKVDKPVNLPRS